MDSGFSANPMIKGGAAAGGDGAELSGGGRGGSKVIIRPDGSFYFEIDSTPGETTIVSWKKLLKDHAPEIAAGASSASKPSAAAGGQCPDVNDPPSASNITANPSMQTPVLGPVGENAGNKAAQPPSNRLNSVIEKIERLYVKGSSDDEDLNDVVPDSDEYDTDDSFIDDSDLNDYFLVDNSTTKHDGFFVHRGKLEGVEPSTLPKEQSKKRRKDLGKSSDGCENDPNPSKLVKSGKKPRKPAQLAENITPVPSTVIPIPNVRGEDEKKSYNVSVGIDQSITQKEKLGVNDRPEAGGGVADVRILHIPKKVGVSARDRSTLLEKAIKDLEKLVAESRPPSAETQSASSARTTKMILPQEIKQELAKVAKYAEATDGMISKELVSRLMSIVGHLVRRRTLKRNLKVMVESELSAKQEKDTMVQLMKKEVAEMVMARIPLMKFKALEQQTRVSQGIGAGEREVLQWKYSMDDLLEDKICDLYDLYAEGLEENAVPQVRKLFAELSALWPNGFMDNHGITRSICRAKDRRKASNSSHKDREEMKRAETMPGNSEAARDLYGGAFLCSSSSAGY